MNNLQCEDALVDLGAATIETKGGPMGYEDQERTLWFHGSGLAED